MTTRLHKLFEKVETWPAEDQAKFIEYAKGIEARRKGHSEQRSERAGITDAGETSQRRIKEE